MPDYPSLRKLVSLQKRFVCRFSARSLIAGLDAALLNVVQGKVLVLSRVQQAVFCSPLRE